jgi:mono/diheme cytochrome c family protein
MVQLKYMFFLLWSAVALTLSCLTGCASKEEQKQPGEKLIKDVYDTQVDLPDAEGAELFTQGAEAFKANCITCHSLRYIQMQPDFPEETWQKIVDKMVKSFGAPIPDSTSKAIVRYLMAIKGKKV